MCIHNTGDRGGTYGGSTTPPSSKKEFPKEFPKDLTSEMGGTPQQNATPSNDGGLYGNTPIQATQSMGSLNDMEEITLSDCRG